MNKSSSRKPAITHPTHSGPLRLPALTYRDLLVGALVTHPCPACEAFPHSQGPSNTCSDQGMSSASHEVDRAAGSPFATSIFAESSMHGKQYPLFRRSPVTSVCLTLQIRIPISQSCALCNW